MSVSQRTRWSVFQRDCFTCQYCGKSITSNPELKLEIDHINPKSKGGTDYIDNLCTACYECNHGKHADLLQFPLHEKEKRITVKFNDFKKTIKKLNKQGKEKIKQEEQSKPINLIEMTQGKGILYFKDAEDMIQKTGLSPQECKKIVEKEIEEHWTGIMQLLKEGKEKGIYNG